MDNPRQRCQNEDAELIEKYQKLVDEEGLKQGHIEIHCFGGIVESVKTVKVSTKRRASKLKA